MSDPASHTNEENAMNNDLTSYHGIVPNKKDCIYTSCYCEENIWKLCRHIALQKPCPIEEVYAIFISNESRMIPLWKQKSSRGDNPVIWDYHVVLLHTSNSGCYIYDLDTILPFPCSLKCYIDEAFRSDDLINPAFKRQVDILLYLLIACHLLKPNPSLHFLTYLFSSGSSLSQETFKL
ncbi:protein N-terminal glutamine amidohydrolase-like [Polypterus senegalus]|uniref:protein N-terminal glutamine amidohydrolase-like n=1 Tax=Polypterus senegalus TaxID=55291 RepID=UPI00196657E5|nr:protein N-terminal glutamine amidohydrolase-like [Polypterus senegalus]